MAVDLAMMLEFIKLFNVRSTFTSGINGELTATNTRGGKTPRDGSPEVSFLAKCLKRKVCTRSDGRRITFSHLSIFTPDPGMFVGPIATQTQGLT